MPVSAIPAQGGLVVTGANLDRMAQAAQPWTTYTPTVTNVTTSTATGRWHRHGDKVTVDFYIVLSAAPTGTITISLPSGVNASASLGTLGPLYPRGVCTGYNGAVVVPGLVVIATSTTVQLLTTTATGASLWSPGIPVAWASTHSMAGHFSYEAA